MKCNIKEVISLGSQYMDKTLQTKFCDSFKIYLNSSVKPSHTFTLVPWKDLPASLDDLLEDLERVVLCLLIV